MTENSESDKKSHYKSNHSSILFKCRVCHGDYVSAERLDVLQHLRDEHSKVEPDEELIKSGAVQIPYDTRRVYCHACSKDNDKVVEWCCQKLKDIEDDLVEHRNK